MQISPWALAFLPGGDLLITEHAGRLRLMHDGRLTAGASAVSHRSIRGSRTA
jgi:glucose/arabinose dehydrogenase